MSMRAIVPLAVCSSLLLFTACGGGQKIAEFEQYVEEVQETAFLEEGTTVEDLARAVTNEAGETVEEEEEFSLFGTRDEESLIDILSGADTATVATNVSHLTILQKMSQEMDNAKLHSVGDPELARITLSHIENTLGYLDRSIGGSGLPEVQESLTVLRQDMVSLRDTLDLVVRVENPMVIADLAGRVSEPLRGGVFHRGVWYLYTTKALVMGTDPYFTDVIEHKVEGGASVLSGTFFPYNNTVVLATSPKGFLEYSDGNLQPIEVSGSEGGGLTAVATYMNRRFLYALDPASNQIWRYNRGGAGYDTPLGSLTQNPLVSDGVSMAIDGNIFVLKSSGEILRYYDGVLRHEFVVQNTPSNYRVATDTQSKIITMEGWRYVYVLNHGLNTVFVYAKETPNNARALRYVKQFVFNEEVVDFTIGGGEQDLLVVTPNKIMSTKLEL